MRACRCNMIRQPDLSKTMSANPANWHFKSGPVPSHLAASVFILADFKISSLDPSATICNPGARANACPLWPCTFCTHWPPRSLRWWIILIVLRVLCLPGLGMKIFLQCREFNQEWEEKLRWTKIADLAMGGPFVWTHKMPRASAPSASVMTWPPWHLSWASSARQPVWTCLDKSMDA